MKNTHYGKGDINVTSGGGSDLLIVAAIAVGAYFLIGVIVHLLMMIIITLGAIAVTTLGGLAIWHFYVEPRINGSRYRIQHLTSKARDRELDEDFPPAIENTRVVLTAEQYEILRRRRDES